MKKIKEEVEVRLLIVFYDRAKNILPAELFLSICLVLFLRNYIPWPELGAWLGASVFLLALMSMLVYRDQEKYVFNSGSDNRLSVRTALLIIATLKSFVWAYAMLFFLVPSEPLIVSVFYGIIWSLFLGVLFMSTSLKYLYVCFLPVPLLAVAYRSFELASYPVEQWVTLGIIFLSGIFMFWVSHTFYQDDVNNAKVFFKNKKLLTEVKGEKEVAENLSQIKSKILAVASHDLRQPVQSLKLLTNVLKKKVEKRNLELVTDIESSVTHLGSLLENVLDLSRLDSGGVHVEKYPTYITELFRQLEKDFFLRAKQKGVVLKVFPIDEALDTDPVLFYRLLSNLLDNAVKYTEEGTIVLQAKKHEGAVLVEIIDTGIGIPVEEQKRVFEEFAQLKKSEETPEEGFGLGLSICLRLSTLLGHDLSLKSILGVGTTLSIKVKIAAVQIESSEGAVMAELEGKYVLVVEHEKDVRVRLREKLEKMGALVLEAKTESEALFVVDSLQTPLSFLMCEYQTDGRSKSLLESVVSAVDYKVPAVLLVGSEEPLKEEVPNVPYVILDKHATLNSLKTTFKEMSSGT